ncbi:MAG: hypothetical protein FWE35_10430 [Streptosporangiales bacterium]|nr:hypothetical protein [Streptosporangiales bacterium]
MTKFTDHLWNDIAAEHGDAIRQSARPAPGRSRRPGMIAGATLALAVGGTALGLGLTGPGGGTPAASGPIKVVTDAYTITGSNSGSILVHVKFQAAISAAEAKLRSMGYDLAIFPKPGAAPAPGPVACTPVHGAPQHPQVKVLLGDNGTQVITANAQNDGTGVGTWHIGSCDLVPASYGNSGPGDTGAGNTGAGNSGAASGSQSADGPAAAILPSKDSSKILWINQRSGLASLGNKLARSGIHGRPDIVLVPGAAPAKGFTVTCKPAAGASGPKLRILMGNDGTVHFGPQTNGGTWHAASCTLLPPLPAGK